MLKPTLNFFLIVIVLWGFKNKKNDAFEHIKEKSTMLIVKLPVLQNYINKVFPIPFLPI